MVKNIGKDIRKILNSKQSKTSKSSKNSATDAFKTSTKRFIQKTAEATGDLTGSKIADKITLPQKNLETNKEILRENNNNNNNNNNIIMNYQNIINLLEETTYQPSKFRTRNWVEINDE